MQEKNDVGRIAREDFEYQANQYQNQRQIRSEINKKQQQKLYENDQENDKYQWKQKSVLGNISSQDTVCYGKKALIIGGSMVISLRMKN